MIGAIARQTIHVMSFKTGSRVRLQKRRVGPATFANPARASQHIETDCRRSGSSDSFALGGRDGLALRHQSHRSELVKAGRRQSVIAGVRNTYPLRSAVSDEFRDEIRVAEFRSVNATWIVGPFQCWQVSLDRCLRYGRLKSYRTDGRPMPVLPVGSWLWCGMNLAGGEKAGAAKIHHDCVSDQSSLRHHPRCAYQALLRGALQPFLVAIRDAP